MTSSTPYFPLDFTNLDDIDGSDYNKIIVSIKADGRAWAYKKGMNYWYLIDVSVLNFEGIKPLNVSVDNALVTYRIDLNTITAAN